MLSHCFFPTTVFIILINLTRTISSPNKDISNSSSSLDDKIPKILSTNSPSVNVLETNLLNLILLSTSLPSVSVVSTATRTALEESLKSSSKIETNLIESSTTKDTFKSTFADITLATTSLIQTTESTTSIVILRKLSSSPFDNQIVKKTNITKSKATTTTASADTTKLEVVSLNKHLNVTSQAGTHAYLPCNVQQIVKKPISWIRIRDEHILTVDQTTFIADQRFQSIYSENPERWSLQIKYVQPNDSGLYECQISTEPKYSAKINLNVVEPHTRIIGESNRHVKAGSQVVIRCTISEALEPPLFINWFFNENQIYLHNKKSWRTEIDRDVITSNDKHNTIASLIIPSVTKKDSGSYTCSPSNSAKATAVLHVLDGEYAASAITSSGYADYLILQQTSTFILILVCFIIIKNFA